VPNMIRTQTVQYIYLDVVQFSRSRSAEAQADIIANLNRIVRDSVNRITFHNWETLANTVTQMITLIQKSKSGALSAPGRQPLAAPKGDTTENVIYLPTGDGMCVALLDPSLPYDTHLRIAVLILDGILQHNEETEDVRRQFDVRIGLNQNADVLITDINGRRNLAGVGINTAQRVMDFADAAQILVSESVHSTLAYHEDYMEQFRQYEGPTKHGEMLRVFQFVDPAYAEISLNVEIPTRFQVRPALKPPLTRYEAYWFARALHSQSIFTRLASADPNKLATIAVFLHLFADHDDINHGVEEYNRTQTWVDDHRSLSVEKVVDKIHGENDHTMRWQFGTLICAQFEDLHSYFQNPSSTFPPVFVNSRGRKKLLNDWPGIAKEFGIESEPRKNSS